MATRAANMQGNNSNADKGLDEKLMDDYLKANGLYRRKIAKDGSCLFRAVAEQVLHCQGLHTKVRAECVKYLRKNRELYESFIEGDFEEYLQRLQDPQSWVGQVEITALAVLYKHDFIIYQNPGEQPVNITENGYPDKVLLCFLNGNHYDSVYPVSFVDNAAMCQSILYELLYERVYGVDRNVITGSMKGSRGRNEVADVEEVKGSEGSDLDEGEDLWSYEATGKPASVNNRPPPKGRGRGQQRGGGRGSLPREVQECLNPGVFRNVEYDTWMRSKKAQQRRDFCMAAGMQYSAGDKCQARLGSTGRFYNAYIQEVSPDDGPVTVFIEELGQKHTVPLWNLRAPSEETWCTVTEKGKRHSVANGNGHTNEWETRGGRKATRSVSVPHASQAATGSSTSNRLQNQHSWPPQAPEEAQSQGKTAGTRKSDQDVGKLGVSPAEEEELLVLELLHKDENNFPSLEASAQAAAGGEGGRRAERKGPRKKADVDSKDSSQKPEQKADKGKHGKKGSVAQDQRISPPVKEKPNPSPPSTPPSANSTAPSAPKALKAAPASSTSASARAGPARSQTIPTPSATPPVSTESTPGQSQTVSVASTTTSGPAQAVPPQSRTGPVGSKTTTAIAPSQTASVPCASASATAAPSTQNTPTQSQTPSAVNPVSTPVASAQTPNPSQVASVPPAASAAKPAQSEAPPVPTSTAVPSPVISQTTSEPLTIPTTKAGATPLSTPSTLPTPIPPETDPVTTIAVPQTTSATTQGPEPTLVSSQTAQATTPALVTTPPQVPTPTPSHIVPTSSVSDSTVPVQTAPRPAEVSGPSNAPPAKVSVFAHTLPEPAHKPHSVTPPVPVNVSAAPAPQFSSSHAPFHPVGHGTFSMMPPYPPYMTQAPTSSAMLAPSAAISSAPTPPYPYPSEPRPYETAPSPAAGLGPNAVPDCLPHGLAPHPQHPQHPFPMPPLPQLIQDPLYPGFPHNDKDEPVQPPYFSVERSGKDLPKDTSILRFFFNLGVKAFTNPVSPPLNYLAPLTQAYMQLKVSPPAPASSPYTPHWPSDNPPSMLHTSPAPSHTHIGLPIGPGGGPHGHFEVRNVVPPPPPVEVGRYGAHPHSVPMHMPPQPAVPWSVSPSPNVYAGIYSALPTGQYSGPPCPPQSGPVYPPPSVGHHHLPGPPPQHRGRDMSMVTVAAVMERGEGDSQRSSTPKVEKSIRLAGGQSHFGGGDNKPVPVHAPMDPQRVASTSPAVQGVSFGSVPSEEAEFTKLANGNKKEDNTTSFQGGAPVGLISHGQSGSTPDEWDLEEAEYGDADLRSGRSYYSRSFKEGGRRGQEDRGGGRGGGFRGRGSRARRDYTGRGRPVNQPYYQRGGYARERGRVYVQYSNTRETTYAGGQFAPAPET